MAGIIASCVSCASCSIESRKKALQEANLDKKAPELEAHRLLVCFGSLFAELQVFRCIPAAFKCILWHFNVCFLGFRRTTEERETSGRANTEGGMILVVWSEAGSRQWEWLGSGQRFLIISSSSSNCQDGFLETRRLEGNCRVGRISTTNQ